MKKLVYVTLIITFLFGFVLGILIHLRRRPVQITTVFSPNREIYYPKNNKVCPVDTSHLIMITPARSVLTLPNPKPSIEINPSPSPTAIAIKSSDTTKDLFFGVPCGPNSDSIQINLVSGKVTIPANCKPDAAAKEFWKAIERGKFK